jgi:hypothetical protein
MAAIEDRLAINDLFARYTTALDAGDVETIVGCFAEDGSLDSRIIGTYSPPERNPRVRHPLCSVPGRRLAVAARNLESRRKARRQLGARDLYLLNVITRNGKSELQSPGRYEKIDGEWLFKHRLVILDHEIRLEGV